MSDKELTDLLYRLKHGLKDEDPVDLRGQHFRTRMVLLRSRICQIYKSNSKHFHHDRSGKIVIEKVVQWVIDEMRKNPSSFEGMSYGEKSIRRAINGLLDKNVIPRYIQFKSLVTTFED